MFFPSFRRQPRRRRQSTLHIEQLEPRELLTVMQLTEAEVTKLLDRASMATSSDDAIIAVVDRGGHILGVRVEQGVIDGIDDAANGGNNNGIIDTAAEIDTLVYAVDGAVAKARTAAFFANGTADTRIVPDGADPDGIAASVGPLTSRTVRNISQSTITQREVQSNPNIADPDSELRGPGFVAPIGIGQHFPPGIPNTPQVDLFAIEHTNRDSIVHAGFDSIRGTADDIALQQRFNIDPAFVPDGKNIDAPESYGFTSGLAPNAQSRGIATLPGGLPIYRIFDQDPGSATFQELVGLDVVGGIGVFFPGTTNFDTPTGRVRIGDATFEQDYPNAQTELARTNAPKVLEAEYAALFAIGGGMFGGLTVAQDRFVGGDFPIPFGRIDLVGITLQIIGPTPGVSGVRTIAAIGNTLPKGDVKLAARINAATPTITVNNAASLPAVDADPNSVDFRVLIDNEILAVTNVVGNTLTVMRGQNGTVATAHLARRAVIEGIVQLSAPIPRITDATISITVTDATVLPAGVGYFVRIDNEILRVASVVTNGNGTATLMVDRAQLGTQVAAHARGKELVAGSGANQGVKVTSSIGATLTAGATTLRVPDASVFPLPNFSITIDKATSSVAVALTAAATTLIVPDASVFPPVSFTITIDGERIAVTNVDLGTNTLTITRAQGGTMAAAHALGSTITTSEQVEVTNVNLDTNTLTITRAQGGTLAAPHGIGETIRTVADFPAAKGRAVPDGWLVMPHDSPMPGTPITAEQVRQIIEQGIIVAADTEARLGLDDDNRRVRSAIRLEVKIAGNPSTLRGNTQQQLNRVRTNPGASAIMVLSVADADGNVLGLYRMHDSTIFSIDVAVAKARNTVYYAGPDLQAIDQVDDNNDGIADVPIGTAFTNRTFRFLAEPRFPQGVDGSQPGPFSILDETVGGVAVTQTEFLRSRSPQIAVRAADNNPLLGPVAASAFQTVLGFDAFNPGRNFRDPDNIANQNGIVFFPGSTPVYAGGVLIGGFGISGDGVDQDDVVTFYGAQGFLPPNGDNVIADEFKVRNIRLPYQKFNRNPFG